MRDIALNLRILALLLPLLNAFALSALASSKVTASPAPTRATLPNGLRVVIIRDSLAPVATVELSVLVGGNESPRGYPGMAHAQEHMAFRGCSGMSSDQTAAIYTQLGGQDNADTEQNVTHYFVTVPSSDLDLALRAQAACTRNIDDSEEEWSQERGAIEQEAAEDLSDPWYRLAQRVDEDLFSGSPYAQDALGTKSSFDALSGEMLQEFYRKWYAPNNMILVVSGDVNPEGTLKKIRDLFGDVPPHDLPPRPAVEFQPVKSETFSIDSDLPNVVGVFAYRFPGTDSADYAAGQVLADVLSSRRGDLYKLETSGRALETDFDFAQTNSKASVAYAEIEVPAGADISTVMHQLQQVLSRYARRGVPGDLVEGAKRNELAHAEFERTSIPGIADVWSDALAAEGRNSPDEDVEAIRKVTTADVNRVAKQYLDRTNRVVATLVSNFEGRPSVERRIVSTEKATAPPVRSVQLPRWAADALVDLTIPVEHGTTSDTLLNNGLRLIVRTDPTSPMILVRGSIKHIVEPQSDVSGGLASEILDGLYSYGTRKMPSFTFERALDDIGAEETAGYHFSLDVLKDNFSRGIQLLAENELRPTFRTRDFEVVKRQVSQMIAGDFRSPEFQSSQALALALLPPDDPEFHQYTPSAFKEIDVNTVKRFYAAGIRPDLTTIVVVGDVSPVEAKRVIEKWFGDWKAVGPTPETILPRVPLNKASSVDVLDPGAMQDSITIGEQLDLDRFDADYYPLQLGNTILGGDFEGSRLYHDLRQVSGYVYSVDLGLDATEQRAMYSISYGCAPENAAKARTLIQQDLEEMRTAEVSAEELHQAKAFLLRQLPLSEASEEDVAAGLLTRAETGLPLNEPTIEAEKYLSINAGQVKAAFAERVRPDDFVQVTRGPNDDHIASK
jgi:zinc protease